MAWLSNPFAFTPGPVTTITSLIYGIIIVALIVLHSSVPNAPTSAVNGVNVTEAWHDLQQLTSHYHPFNSRKNDEVREWLLLSIAAIFARNSVSAPDAYLFSDTSSNLTFSSPGSTSGADGICVYFEGTNIIVYIRGSEDGDTEWWDEDKGKPSPAGGVLVNAHYDSVSTGYGATDDGVAVVSILQLISYFTTPGNKPKKGLVALLNNGEEDFLNGARVFSQHPMSKFAHAFLNLEGAGAGGKATLFRSTDAEVTNAYGNSPYPFGSVISGDGFAKGLIRSQTDYIIFNGYLGLRGLDVAFMEPRSRYHTDEDTTRHTGKNSLWHMLSAALATTKALTMDDTYSFEGESMVKGGVNAGEGSQGVWFDLFGRVFAVFQLHTMFALSVTLLVVTPIVLLITMIILSKVDKFYLFSGSQQYHSSDGDEAVALYGWRGFFRFPFIFAVSSAVPIALAYLVFKENPFIVHSSEWSVWSMMFTSFIFCAWFLCRSADYARPSSLTRAYGLTWMFVAWWAVLVADTVFENHMKIAGGYFVLFYFVGLFLATWISYLELFALPKKAKYCLAKVGSSKAPSDTGSQHQDSSSHGRPPTADSNHTGEEGGNEDGEDPTEQTGLLAKKGRTTFANYSREEGHEDQTSAEDDTLEAKEGYVYGDEQDWSENMPRWTWLLQFLLLAPFNIILITQIGLLVVSALHQTGPDGSSIFLAYIFIAVLSILILSPLVPFLHRYSWQIPTFMVLVLAGTIAYNLVAFPFSSNNRLKLFFQQEVDLDTGLNMASLIGPPFYVQQAIDSFPSASGQSLDCVHVGPGDREKCSWPGLPPQVVDPISTRLSQSRASASSWVTFNVTRSNTTNTARFNLFGRNTRACKLKFDSPISSFEVHGAAPNDKRFPPVPESGSKEIRLWSRTWSKAWTVDLEWEGQGEHEGEVTGMAGKVICLWSDANHDGVIPALDEAKHYAPDWVAITKAGDGLVEASKKFSI